MPSSVGTPAPLIEPQSAWNVRVGRCSGALDLDVLQCRSKYSDGPENAPEKHFVTQNEFFLGEGTLLVPSANFVSGPGQ